MPAVRTHSPTDEKPDVKSDVRPSRKPAVKKAKAPKPASSRLPEGCKKALAQAVISAGLKSVSLEMAAEASGLTVAQVRKQLEAGRGVRRALSDFAETLGP